jgi:hypothetical protein
MTPAGCLLFYCGRGEFYRFCGENSPHRVKKLAELQKFNIAAPKVFRYLKMQQDPRRKGQLDGESKAPSRYCACWGQVATAPFFLAHARQMQLGGFYS